MAATRLTIVAIATFGLLACPARAQDFPASASFAQLDGSAGCVVQAGDVGDDDDRGCARSRALIGPEAIAVAPDQRHVYVASTGNESRGSNAVTVFARDPSRGSLDFSSCVSDNGGDGRVGTDGFCADGDALLGADGLAFSPDGRFLYVTAFGSSSVSWFAVDPSTGALTPQGCVKAFPRQDRCRAAAALVGADGVAVSADGATVYVTAAKSGAVTAFARDGVTGALAEIGCVSDSGSDGRCIDGTGLQGASSVAVSSDGRDVYVTAAGIGAVTSYRRDAAGRLRPAGCLVDGAIGGGSCESAPALAGASDAVLTPDGRQLLVASADDSALAVFARDAATGRLTPDVCFRSVDPQGDDVLGDDGEEGDEEDDADESVARDCRPAKAIFEATRVAVSPDGRGVFVSSPGDYLAAFARDPDTGALRQFGCAEEARTYRSCTHARNMTRAHALAVSGDARSLYVATDDGVSVFAASTAIDTQAAVIRRNGSIRIKLGCPAAARRACRGRLAIVQPRAGSPSRRFRVRRGHVARVTLTLSRRVRRAARRHRRVHVTVRARDARQGLRAPTRRVVLRAHASRRST